MYVVEQRDDATIIGIEGDLDTASSPQLASMISMAEKGPHKRIIVSLEHCQFCDASGLSVLVRAQKRLEVGFFVVVPARARCHRIFEITGLTKALQLVSTVEGAIREGLDLGG